MKYIMYLNCVATKSIIGLIEKYTKCKEIKDDYIRGKKQRTILPFVL